MRYAGRWWGIAAGLLVGAALVSTIPTAPAGAQGVVPDIALQTLATGLPAPTQVTHAGDSRLFVVIQRGQVVIWDGQGFLSQPFLDIQHLVSCCGERGLLSIAFHPRWTQNGFFFVNYTDGNGNTVVARYRVSAFNPNVADPQSASILLHIMQPFANHNGGQLQFGPDGYLYIGMGDGGSANDPECNGQRDDTLLGKMLRIDVDQNPTTPPFYGIPADNPHVGPLPPLDEIWAKGLRNPWRFSFDRETGDLWIGDVGQGAREEIDFEPASSAGGLNYGWKLMEGSLCGAGPTACPGNQPQCGAPQLVRPIYEYSHANGDCSVTGGFVYRGTQFPALRGVYVYGDYCTGRLWGGTRLFTPRAPGVTSFGEDAFGELYLVTDQGRLQRIVNPLTSPSPTPSFTASLTPTTTASPTTTLTPSATLTPTITLTPSPVPTPLPRVTPVRVPPNRPSPRILVRPI